MVTPVTVTCSPWNVTGSPDADYAGVLAAVFGDLALVPWQRVLQVPTAKMLGTWRAALGRRRWPR